MSLTRRAAWPRNLLFGFALALSFTPPEVGGAETAALAASRVQVTAQLPLAGLVDQVRNMASQAAAMNPSTSRETHWGDIEVMVRATPLARSLQLNADARGRLTVRVPIQIEPSIYIPWYTATLVAQHGCGSARYTLSLQFVPRFTHGRLQYVAGTVTAAAPRGYRCEIRDHFGALHADVSARITGALVATGNRARGNFVGRLNAWVPDTDALLAATLQPVDFGGALSLGMDAPRLVFNGAAACGSSYCLTGFLEGMPRLHFGSGHAIVSPLSNTASGDGFHLPTMLLFPTDQALLPNPDSDQASGWLGDFRLRPVAHRQDLAVLQRRAGKNVQNVIWLSGGEPPVAGRHHLFERPMDNVLQEILEWLDESESLRGVDGIAELKVEVTAFMRLLAHFQQDTEIPLDERGSLQFRELRVDLHSLWVTDEAIWAQVVLRGEATLELRWAL